MKLLIALSLFVISTTSNAQTLGLKACVESCFTKYDKQSACVAKKPSKAKKVKKRKIKRSNIYKEDTDKYVWESLVENSLT